MEYGAPTLYFHFYTPRGHAASLPMKRVESPLRIKGVKQTDDGKTIGYRCTCCAKAFFAANTVGLKHECMNNAGVISARA